MKFIKRLLVVKILSFMFFFRSHLACHLLARPTWSQPAKPIYPHIIGRWFHPKLSRFDRFASATVTALSIGLHQQATISGIY